MKMKIRHIGLIALIYLVYGVDFSLAQPPALPSAPTASASGQDPAKETIDGLIEQLRQVLYASVAVMPDDVVAAMLKIAQHPDNLIQQKPHPTDTEFNQAAGYLFDEYPEVFSMMNSNPISTALLGQVSKGDTAAAWSSIDQLRTSPEIAALMQGKEWTGETPTLNIDTSGLDASINQATGAANQANQTAKSYVNELNELNNSIDKAEGKLADAEAKTAEVEEDLQNPGSSKEVTAISAAVGAKDFTSSASSVAGSAGGINPFGARGAGAGGLSRGFGVTPDGRNIPGMRGGSARGIPGGPGSRANIPGQAGKGGQVSNPMAGRQNFSSKGFGISEGFMQRRGGMRGGPSMNRGGSPRIGDGGIGGPGGPSRGGRGGPGGPGGGVGRGPGGPGKGPGGPGPGGPGPKPGP